MQHGPFGPGYTHNTESGFPRLFQTT